MPRFLPSALDALGRWPVVEGTYYYVDGFDRMFLYPPGGRAITEYLHSISVWRRFGFEVDADLRGQIRELWKHRPDLRYVLGEAIGHYVCDEFKRPFVRDVLGGGIGDYRAWVEAYPDLRAPLLEHFHGQLRRFNHPFEVVHACSVLTREFGEPLEIWRAAALAIHRDDRRQARRAPARRGDFLRHDLETHGTLFQGEGEILNGYLEELGGERLEVMEFGFWWHPVSLPGGQILARLVEASHGVAGDRWGEEDVQRYARLLAALPADEARWYNPEDAAQREVEAAARALRGDA
ncbi:MAG: hypothetical protein R3B09_18535 [Nannocystaceae bacterium]